MKIAYAIPAPMHLTEMGAEEMEKRQLKLRSWAFPQTEVDVVSTERGPQTIESIYEEYLTLVPFCEMMEPLAARGYDAVIIGCFGDPGLDGVREISDLPVVGPASASMAFATTLGHRFSVITVTESVVHALKRLAWDGGMLDALTSVRFIDSPVLEIHKDRDRAVGKMLEEGEKAILEGADTLVLGCMTMGFLDVAEEMSARLGIPVINPGKAALKLAETSVSMGLRHSQKAYPTPPKLAAGMSMDELLVVAPEDALR